VTGYTPPGVESPVPFRSSARPPGGKAGIALVSDCSPAALWRQCVPRLGCLLRLNVSLMVMKMVGCVFFSPHCEQQLGNSPSYGWRHITESRGHQCNGSGYRTIKYDEQLGVDCLLVRDRLVIQAT
jgi:hypothetical protein